MAPAGEVAVDISGVLAHRIIYLRNRPVVPDYIDWQFFKTELVQSRGANVQWLTSSSLTKRDGDLTIVIKVNGQPVKSYRAQVRGGKPVRLARTRWRLILTH